MLLLTPLHHRPPFAHPHDPLASGSGCFDAASAPATATAKEKDEGVWPCLGRTFQKHCSVLGWQDGSCGFLLISSSILGSGCCCCQPTRGLVLQPWLTASASPPAQYPEFLRIHVALLEQVGSPADRGLQHPLGSPQPLGAVPRMQLVWPPGVFGCQGELGEWHSHQQACRQERHELIFSQPTQRVRRELGGGGERKN